MSYIQEIEKPSILLMNDRVLHHIYVIGVDCNSKVYVYDYVDDYLSIYLSIYLSMNVIIYLNIWLLVILSSNWYMYCLVLQNETHNLDCFDVCCKCT
jgi:hypothetical protein